MRALPVTIPAAAGAVFLAWGLIASMGGGRCGNTAHEGGVDSWAFVGVFTALMFGIFGATILARRLVAWQGLAPAGLLVLAIALGAQLGWAIGMAWAGCAWEEGPALALTLFAVPGTILGFVSGSILRHAKA